MGKNMNSLNMLMTLQLYSMAHYSHNGILRVLDYFAHMSGLKTNFSKAKVEWIGGKKSSFPMEN